MDETKFWSIIDQAREAVVGSPDPLEDMLDALQESLEDLEDADLIQFQQLMREKYWQAFTYDLSGAVFVINSGNGDEDDFHGFRGWLIAQGRAYFDRVVAHPDSLADDDLVPSNLYLPDILTLAHDVFRDSTASEMPEDLNFIEPDEPTGADLNVDELPKRLPKLCFEFIFRSVEETDESDIDEDEQAEANP